MRDPDELSDDRRPPADLVITGARVLLHDDAGDVVFADDHRIIVQGSTIAAVEPDTGAVPAATEVIDARGRLAMPGFINCHTHSPMVMFRGVAEDVPDERWFNEFIWPMEVNLTEEDVEVATWLAAAEMIRSGVTTFADHYFDMGAIARVVDASGLRAVLGSTYFSTDAAAGLEQSLAFALEHRGSAGGRITTALAPHATYTVSDADLAATASASHEHGLLVHIHAAESRTQTRHSLERHGYTPIEALRRAGLLDTRTLIAHGIGIVPEDLPALSAASGRVGVGSAPKGYLKQGPDTTPMRLLAAAGVPVGLATDGAASNNTLDVWESMTYLSLVNKATERDQAFLPARTALRHATTESAAALGMTGAIGRLAPGHQADIVLVDLTAPRLQPIHDLASTLVLSGRSDDIDTTIVAGRVLMRERNLLTVDVATILEDLGPRLARLTDRSHGRRIQDYDA